MSDLQAITPQCVNHYYDETNLAFRLRVVGKLPEKSSFFTEDYFVRGSAAAWRAGVRQLGEAGVGPMATEYCA